MDAAVPHDCRLPASMPCSCMENVVKECEEEASIPPELAARAKPVGAVSYTSLQPAGLKRDVLFCFDLKLPVDFVPQPLVSTSRALHQ